MLLGSRPTWDFAVRVNRTLVESFCFVQMLVHANSNVVGGGVSGRPLCFFLSLFFLCVCVCAVRFEVAAKGIVLLPKGLDRCITADPVEAGSMIQFTANSAPAKLPAGEYQDPKPWPCQELQGYLREWPTANPRWFKKKPKMKHRNSGEIWASRDWLRNPMVQLPASFFEGFLFLLVLRE